MTSRRGFLGSILAAGFAPAAIGSGVLMPVRPIIAPPLFTSGFDVYANGVWPRIPGYRRLDPMFEAEAEAINRLLGERMRLVREMTAYSVLRGHA